MTGEIFRILAIAFAFSLLGLSAYLSCRVLKVIDFTCDASLSIGGCSYAAVVLYGLNPIVAIIISGALGASAGFITASLTTNLKIKTTVTSVITFILSQILILKMYSIGSFSIQNKLSTMIPSYPPILLLMAIGGISAIMCFIFHRIINSEYGLAMKVYSDGPIVSESLGIDHGNMLKIGLMLSNALVGLSGGLIVQTSKAFCPTMGVGTFVFGLGVILLVMKSYPNIDFKKGTLVCAVCAFIYKLIIDILARFIGGDAISGAMSEYEHTIAAIFLIILIALTFNEKNTKNSILHIR